MFSSQNTQIVCAILTGIMEILDRKNDDSSIKKLNKKDAKSEKSVVKLTCLDVLNPNVFE